MCTPQQDERSKEGEEEGSKTRPSCSAENGETHHSDMEMVAGGFMEQNGENPSYNPKYSVRLSSSTTTMFPNYHSPESTVVVVKGKESERKSFPFPLIIYHWRSILCLISLSLHSGLEANTIGLKEVETELILTDHNLVQDVDKVWHLMMRMTGLQVLLTFSFSLELLQAGITTKSFALYVFTFAIVR